MPELDKDAYITYLDKSVGMGPERAALVASTMETFHGEDVWPIEVE